MRTVILKRLGLGAPTQDRALLGNDVLENPIGDGTLSPRRLISKPRDLGNITERPIADIIDGSTYRNLITEEKRLKESVLHSVVPSWAHATLARSRATSTAYLLQDLPNRQVSACRGLRPILKVGASSTTTSNCHGS
ncbi:hypothetical protein I545_7021 [Mycobacterium kansasii 662]|uniref:Uncharacterized protein n=1 Tax=Mycobacterium kansasii 662 TaxID=1299326 RepID=X7XQ23_MYCKA|nr:hypothetical protein I545_7021 [Mycobacterium kansasii 662]